MKAHVFQQGPPLRGGLKTTLLMADHVRRPVLASTPKNRILPGAEIESWMFAPGGDHVITPAAGEGSAELVIRVDESTATILSAALQKLNERHHPQRAFFDHEHDATSGATAWPIHFVWQESPAPGVYAQVVPSAFGQHLVDGRIVRSFSPSFYSDAALPKTVRRGQHLKISAAQRGSPENPARMVGLVFPGCGTLTNNPAFRQMMPLWARKASR